jgi:hypothetical protein
MKELLGNPVDSATLEELGLNTPEYPLYKDKFEGTYQPTLDADEILPLPDQDEVTSEHGDIYTGADVDHPIKASSCREKLNNGREMRKANYSVLRTTTPSLIKGCIR